MNLTQVELAVRAGVSPRFLVQLEGGRGNISVNRLADVCGSLNLSLEDLFRGLGPGGPEKLTLVGLRGAGKSTIGAVLANHLDVPFIEIDDRIAAAAGLSLSEIFEVGGSGLYRELEGRVIEQVIATPGGAVLAAGGSLVTSADAWQLLREHTRTVWLKASPESHLQRVINQGDLRPIEGRPDALRELTDILAARAPLYAMAHITLDTEDLGLDGVVTRLEGLMSRG
ncbi:MAG: XRE family aerobic/anaerobic benzoate catabolism transcriptional regulator [Myxococcota bacterium]|jgi:XRE family aerobic/anaerobic benzoate catabolism transcriptional regulator